MTLGVNLVFRKLPGSLLALAAATGVVAWLGVEALGVQVVGKIPGAVPRATDIVAAWSFFRGGAVGAMLTGALAISLLGLIEAVSIARTIARESGQRLDVNQEFVGQGLANIATGLLSGYTCSGSFTRSAVNYQAGARSPLAGVYTGLAILVGALLMAPYLAFLPRAGVAGVIMLVAWGMVDRQGMRRVLRTSRQESAVMIVTFGATLMFPLEFAVLSGVIFSLAMYVHASSLPRVYPVVPDPTYRHLVERPSAPACPQLGVMNVTGTLFFGATQHVEDVLMRNRAEHPDQRYLMLRMHAVHRCDFTGIEMLESVVHSYREQGGDVFMVQVRPAVAALMHQTGFDAMLGEDHFLTQEEAIDVLFDTVIDTARCRYACHHKVFAECQTLPRHPSDVAIPASRPATIDASRLLTVEQVVALLEQQRALVIDVREPDEYRAGHLRGARSLPLRELLARWEELPRDRPLLLVSRAGRRCRRAMSLLLGLGYTDVQAIKGGILGWKAADLPLDTQKD
jgi:SulP family sulfate permease